MDNKVAVIIVNYNMPERADALFKHISAYAEWPCDIILVDNGSDLVPPARCTNLWLPENRQTTGGWLAGLKFATEYDEYFAYWFLITSAEFVDEADPLSPLARFLAVNPSAVGVHPALTEDSTTSWEHMKIRGGDQPRKTWFIDNIASLYYADWFDEIGRFDPELKYAWGIDLETCWKARQQGRSLWIHEGVQVKKTTNIGYTMNRMNMSAEERHELASANIQDVLGRRYGANWWDRMLNEGTLDEWR